MPMATGSWLGRQRGGTQHNSAMCGFSARYSCDSFYVPCLVFKQGLGIGPQAGRVFASFAPSAGLGKPGLGTTCRTGTGGRTSQSACLTPRVCCIDVVREVWRMMDGLHYVPGREANKATARTNQEERPKRTPGPNCRRRRPATGTPATWARWL